MSLEQLHGAWRIEEVPRDRQHGYGYPNTHWLILGDRGLTIREEIPTPLTFQFRIETDNRAIPNQCYIQGDHGGRGYYEIDGEMLFIGLGRNGVKPPRFASDCGDFFAFTRDRCFDVPAIPVWPRANVESKSFGLLTWDHREPEYLGDWTAQTKLHDNMPIEVRISDYLVPLDVLLPMVEVVFHWLQTNLEEVVAVCAERVCDWVDEDEQYSQLSREEVATTISIDSIDASNLRVYLWASTTLPIDHSIRVFLEIEGSIIRASGASIEG